MTALIFLFGIVVFVSMLTYRKISKNIRSEFLFYQSIILFVGAIFIVLYTAENSLIRNQIDMEGDAQYLYYGAEDYVKTKQFTTLYPYYVFFISLFLVGGNVITIRFAQLLVFILIYDVAVFFLDKHECSQRGIKYFSFFTVFNGAFYAYSTIIVRDLFILLHMLLSFVFGTLLIDYALRAKRITVTRFSSLLGAFLIVVYGIYSLAPFLAYIIIFVLFVAVYASIIILKTKIFRKILVAVILTAIPLTLLFTFIPISKFIRLYQVNVLEKTLLMEEATLSGQENIETNPVLALLRFLLGPGLIRPLVPEQYFLVYTEIFAFFNWWAVAVWYLNLVLTLPKVLQKPFSPLSSPFSMTSLLIFITYSVAYAVAYGGPGGLRKRMVSYFFYTLMISLTYYRKEAKHLGRVYQKRKRRVSQLLLMVLIIVMLAAVQIQGI
ncbi:hypothetical protein [Fervidobacterium sp.]